MKQKLFYLPALLVFLLFSLNANAITPKRSWADSYSANGKCYCATTFDHGIGNYIVDTPAGRKTVREVCRKIGSGPGKGRNPVYNTVQCGHEPGHDDAIRINGRLVKDEKVCPGRVDRGSSGCNTKGPKWDLSVFGSSNPPSTGNDLRCTVIGSSLSQAESLFSSQCSSFDMADCDDITVNGESLHVCSSLRINNDAAIATGNNDAITIQAEDYARARDSQSGNRGGDYRSGDVDVQRTGDSGGGHNVGWIDSNEWLEFDVYVSATADYTLESRVASTRSTGEFSIEVDGSVAARDINVPNTGNWQSYRTITSDLGRLTKGYHKIRVDVDAGGFNLNWLKLVAEEGEIQEPSVMDIQTDIDGRDVSVDVEPDFNRSRIRQVDLYVDGQFVRTERVYPYTWNVVARTNDTELQNMSSGAHTIRAVIIENNGTRHDESIDITIP